MLYISEIFCDKDTIFTSHFTFSITHAYLCLGCNVFKRLVITKLLCVQVILSFLTRNLSEMCNLVTDLCFVKLSL